MSRTLQFRRLGTATLANTTGANGELIINSTNKTLTVHDGVLPGGYPLLNSATDNNIDQVARNTANAATSNVIIIQGVDATQNNNISNAANLAQAAFDAANTGGGIANLGDLKISGSAIGTTDGEGGWGGYDLILTPNGEGNAYVIIPKDDNVANGALIQINNYSEFGGGVQLGAGSNTWTFDSNGILQLPQGGIIAETSITNNPTVVIAPAQPDVESQVLLIKGGGTYNSEENDIALNWYIINPLVGDTVEIYVNSLANANTTLYWWIHPTGANISNPDSGTVALGEGGASDSPISFTVDSDDYEFTVRVSPTNNVYDPATIGVETLVFNSNSPAFGDHHLHLTTADLTETSIILGTDDHNVRTTVNGGVEINTFLYPDGGGSAKWTFDNNGALTLPSGSPILFGNGNSRIQAGMGFHINSEEGISLEAVDVTDPLNPITKGWYFGTDGNLTLPSGNTTIGNLFGSDAIISDANTIFGVLSQGSTGLAALQWFDSIVEPMTNAGISVNSPYATSTGSVQIYTGIVGPTLQNAWTFGTDGKLTLPGAVVKSTVAKTGGNSDPQGNVVTVTLSPTTAAWANSTYFVGSGGIDINVTVFNGTMTLNSVSSTAGTYRVGDTVVFDGGLFNGQSTTDDVTLTVDTITTAATYTAIDLAKSINKLADGAYTLADGIDGQIMYLVMQNGVTGNIQVFVDNARVNQSLYTDYPLSFNNHIITLIFTDGAWQQSGGSWD